jgi:hypothetical protein
LRISIRGHRIAALLEQFETQVATGKMKVSLPIIFDFSSSLGSKTAMRRSTWKQHG